jgi:Glycosyl transferase family 2
MQIKCPNVPISALLHIADYVRGHGANVTFSSSHSGIVDSSSGSLDFFHDGVSSLTVTITNNALHFPSRMIVGGVRQAVEEMVEKLRAGKDSRDELVCVIPAYNEGDISAVLVPIIQSGVFDRIVVVDDGSDRVLVPMRTDIDPARVVGYELLMYHVGKSKAVAHVLRVMAKEPKFICLMDADLIGLTKEDVVALVAPVLSGKADASLSSRKSYGGLWNPKLDIFTGERVVGYDLLMRCGLGELDSMGMEMAINNRLIEEKARIAVVPWPGVSNRTKTAKWGLVEGLRKEKEMYQTLWRKGPVGIMKQVVAMGKQVV